MDKETLYILIDRYFEATTTPLEEQLLLRELLNQPPGDRKVEEALAVMGAARFLASGDFPDSTCGQKPLIRKPALSIPLRRYAVAAASLTLIIAGSIFIYRNLQDQPGYLAYSGGERIENREDVLAIMRSQLNEISEAADEISVSIESDLSEIYLLLDENSNDNRFPESTDIHDSSKSASS